MADEDVARAVGDDLATVYPGYSWMVGCDHEAGQVVIDLGVTKPAGYENYAYALNIATCTGAGGRQKVMRAGGELLERFGLKRGAATADFMALAKENGLDIHGAKYAKRHHTT
jgi:hypothetical protein